MTGLLGPNGAPLSSRGPLGQMEPLQCGSQDCTEPAVVAFWLRDQAGHIHDCRRHEAAVREHCDVVSSKRITPGQPCPALACTPAPIATAVPTLLERPRGRHG